MLSILESIDSRSFSDHFKRNQNLYLMGGGLLAGGLGLNYWLNRNNNIPKSIPAPVSVNNTDKTVTKPNTEDIGLPPEKEPPIEPPNNVVPVPSIVNDGMNQSNDIIKSPSVNP